MLVVKKYFFGLLITSGLLVSSNCLAQKVTLHNDSAYIVTIYENNTKHVIKPGESARVTIYPKFTPIFTTNDSLTFKLDLSPSIDWGDNYHLNASLKKITDDKEYVVEYSFETAKEENPGYGSSGVNTVSYTIDDLKE